MTTRDIIVHAANSVYGRHNLYGARSAHIARYRGKSLPVVAYCRDSEYDEHTSGTVVRRTPLSPPFFAVVGLLAVSGLKTRRLRVESAGFDRAAARRLTAAGDEKPVLFHAWEWMPRTLRALKDRNPDVPVIRDITIARRHEWRSGQDICVEDEFVDVFFSPSAFVTSCLADWGVRQEKIVEIPFGVDVERYQPARERPQGPVRFAFSGAITGRKGITTLLQAWEGLRLANAELHFYGNVYADVGAAVKAAHNVHVHGFVDLTRELPLNHVFVFPSTLEGSSKSVYEALACGLPTVTTFNSGSVVRHNQEGLIVDVGDVEALAEAMDRLYRDGSLRTEMGLSARNRAEQFTWDHYAEKVWDTYERLIGNTAYGTSQT